MTLQQRAEAFLVQDIPEELLPSYVSGSISEMLVSACAAGTEIDPEDREMVSICAFESNESAGRAKTLEAQAFWSEQAEILTAMEASIKDNSDD